jgi:hypothetical protein
MEGVVKRRWVAMAGAEDGTRVPIPLPSGSATLSKVSPADQVLGKNLGTIVFTRLMEKAVSVMVALATLTVVLVMTILFVVIIHHNIHAHVGMRIGFQGEVDTAEGIGLPMSKVLAAYVVIEEWTKIFYNRLCRLWLRRSLQRHRKLTYLLMLQCHLQCNQHQVRL